MRREYELRGNCIVCSLNDLGLPCFEPLAASRVFPQITSSGLTGQEFSLSLLEGIRTSPASAAPSWRARRRRRA